MSSKLRTLLFLLSSLLAFILGFKKTPYAKNYKRSSLRLLRKPWPALILKRIILVVVIPWAGLSKSVLEFLSPIITLTNVARPLEELHYAESHWQSVFWGKIACRDLAWSLPGAASGNLVNVIKFTNCPLRSALFWSHYFVVSFLKGSPSNASRIGILFWHNQVKGPVAPFPIKQ